MHIIDEKSNAICNVFLRENMSPLIFPKNNFVLNEFIQTAHFSMKYLTGSHSL